MVLLRAAISEAVVYIPHIIYMIFPTENFFDTTLKIGLSEIFEPMTSEFHSDALSD